MTPANGKGKEGEGEESKWARNEVRRRTAVYGGVFVLITAPAQLKATLTALEADLEDLEESVRWARRTFFLSFFLSFFVFCFLFCALMHGHALLLSALVRRHTPVRRICVYRIFSYQASIFWY